MIQLGEAMTRVRSNGHVHKVDKFTTITGEQLLQSPVIELPMLVDALIPKVGVSIFAGASDLGKSAVLRQLSVAICIGEERFLGFPLNPIHKSALFIASEDDDISTAALLHKVCTFDSDGLRKLRFVFDCQNLEHTIRASLEQAPADLVVVDCMLDFYGLKQLNQANDFRTWLNPFKTIAAEHKTQIVFLHHIGKRADEREPSKSNLLGSSAIEHAPRLVLELRAGDQPEQRFLCILKANFLAPEVKSEAHELRFKNMVFTSTGLRRPLSEVFKRSPERSPEQREQLVEQARTLSVQGKSQRDIARQLNISLGAVNGYLKANSGVHVQPNPRVSNELNAQIEAAPF